MKIKFLLPLNLLLLSITGTAQVLVQDAAENSTIKYQGSTINVDATKARASFNLNQINKAKSIDLIGVQASADGENGIFDILKTGNVVPKATLNVNFGWVFENEVAKNFVQNYKLLEELATYNGEKWLEFEGKIQNFMDKFSDDNFSDNQNLKDALKKVKAELSKDYVGKIQALANLPANSKEKPKLEELANIVARLVSVGPNTKPFSQARIAVLKAAIQAEQKLYRHLIYGSIGGSASKFIYTADPANINFDSRFVEKKPSGAKFGIGYNGQRGGKEIWGFNVTWEKANNFSLLDPTEYNRTTTVETTKTSGTDPVVKSVDKVEGKKTFSSYEGKIPYHSFFQTSLNADYVRFYPGISNSNSVLVMNYYIRQKFTNRSYVYPEITTIGLGSYFFKATGSFVGGLYFELRDLFGNVDRIKTEPTQTSVHDRFVFGIVTKFNIGSVISPSL